MIYDTIVSRSPVKGGWTPDRKYRAEAADGTRYFLRIAAPGREEHLERVFRLQRQAAAPDIPMAQPLESGFCPEGFYTLETWIEGEDARDAIPKRSPDALYADGLSAGRILKRIHAVPAPADLPDWAQRFGEKIHRKVAEYLACPLKYEHDEAFLSGVSENLELLTGRPQCLQHGDFHAGNFLYEKGRLKVIDFDRCGFGDPWEDYTKILWTAAAAPALARGQVDGYFDGQVPEEFWRLLLLYTCVGQLSSLPWAIPYGEAEVHLMREKAKQVEGWYAGGVVPSWYR